MIDDGNVDRDIVQLGWIVPNLFDAIQVWHENYQIGPFFVNAHVVVEDLLYRGRPATLDFSAALVQMGNVQIELIEQHCDSPSAYRDLIPAGGQGLHHICRFVKDYHLAIDAHRRVGRSVASEGIFGELQFGYVDTVEQIGAMTEVIEGQPRLRDLYGQVAVAADEWDGRNLVRNLMDLF